LSSTENKTVTSGYPVPLLSHCTDYAVTIRALCLHLASFWIVHCVGY